ncbi:HupE/UreJ family protein [Pleionea mediterranea]|uniref:Hydrogenase/urease accessory protein HupE n=1 Tax=Pleionea mediterranea TaxID=523701 RepID=A0A316FAU5_9GAMM|nr:HupE/UreJ family protein [Pleionea mediterranea]PWK45385.1 hydrogenase/urease accessory protein HupE [Pleionea mediterranea]
MRFFQQTLFTVSLYFALSTASLFCNSLSAHEFSTAQLSLKADADNNHHGFIALRLQDLQQQVGVDRNNDGKLTWQETLTSLPDIHNYLTANLQFKQATPCAISWQDSAKLMTSYDETLLRLPLSIQCATSDSIQVSYQAFFARLPQHKLLINWRTEQSEQSSVQQQILSQQKTSFEFSYEPQTAWDTFNFYWQQGVIHIWIGLDHILFLLALILPLAGYQSSRRIANKTASSTVQTAASTNDDRSLLQLLKHVAWLVTFFTLAHSLTLILTALGWINLPSQWIETGIALSVMFAAINVITQWVTRLGWLTFAFGLLHGMGFAGALGELGLPQHNQVLGVLAFNLGVEVGQLVIVLLTLPVFYLLRRFTTARGIVIPASATAIALFGGFWILERLNIIG